MLFSLGQQFYRSTLYTFQTFCIGKTPFKNKISGGIRLFYANQIYNSECIQKEIIQVSVKIKGRLTDLLILMACQPIYGYKTLGKTQKNTIKDLLKFVICLRIFRNLSNFSTFFLFQMLLLSTFQRSKLNWIFLIKFKIYRNFLGLLNSFD